MKKDKKGSVGPGSYNAEVVEFSTKKSKYGLRYVDLWSKREKPSWMMW